MRIVGKTDIGKRRGENQDSFRSGYLPGGYGWGIVCDGMGGGQDGRLASTVAVEAVEKALRRGLRENPPPEAILPMLERAIEKANSEVYHLSGNGAVVMGTTVVCAVMTGDELFVAHAGDSRIYLYENGVLQQLTRDHSMVQELLDSGALTASQALNHPNKNVITRALGVEAGVEIESSRRPISPESLVLLCTDGLTNMIDDEEMRRLVGESAFYEMANRLVEAALLAGGFDNITVLVMQNHKHIPAKEALADG